MRVLKSFAFVLSIFGVCDDSSGTNATAMEEMNVLGIVIRGSAIPVIIPNSAIASDSESPNSVSLNGIIKDISIVTSEDAVLASVIDELSFIVPTK